MVEAAQKIVEVLPAPFEGDAWALLATVYKDTQQPLQTRLFAAKAAIAYERPALSAIDARIWRSMSNDQTAKDVIEA